MPRKARKDLETGFFHVMVQGIKKEEITLRELQEDKRLIKKLYNSMELKPTKTKLAENIGISRIKLSKILNDYKEIKKKN